MIQDFMKHDFVRTFVCQNGRELFIIFCGIYVFAPVESATAQSLVWNFLELQSQGFGMDLSSALLSPLDSLLLWDQN